MFKLTESPEFMAELQAAVVLAARNAGLGAAPAEPAPEEDWLCAAEAIAFLRTSRTGFKQFKKRFKDKLILSFAVGTTEPRYQRASLQAIMLAKSNSPDLPLTGEPPRRRPTARAGRGT